MGETGTETFTVATADGSTSASVVVTVTGADDAARIEGDTTGAVTEDNTSLAEASGRLEVVDPDTALTNEQKRFTAQTDVDGTYGTFTLEADGGWTYELDNADTDTNALGAGETETETFIVATADGTSASVVITVTGANDAARDRSGHTTGAVTEDATTTTATGALTVADPDEGEATFEERANVEGTYGVFALEADGSWTYTLNNADADTNALGAGETETETFIVATADGTTAQVVITVTGANDAAAIGGQTTGAVTEDAATTTATGALTVADPDAGEATFEEQSNVEGTYGTFTLEADGGWTYTLNNADTDTNALAVGETGTETFTVATADGTSASVVVTVTGADDAATHRSGHTTGAVTEDDTSLAEASGTLKVADPDTALTNEQKRFTEQTDVDGTYGTFTLEADGGWTYELDNADTDTNALAVGETGTETFTVATADGSTSASVVVTVTGADDAARIEGDTTGAVTEDDTSLAEASGTLEVVDPDTALTNEQKRFTEQTDVDGTYGTFTLEADGGWSYELDNADTDTNALGAGETGTETFIVATADGTSASVVITVTGANDAAAIGGQTTGAVTEDAVTTTATGALTVADPDEGEATFEERANVEGTYGTFTLEADGSWTYTLNNADTDTNALGAGETETETFIVATADGTTAQVVITVTGANDAAAIGGQTTGAVTEDAATTTATGALTVADPDAGEATFEEQSNVEGTYGTFTLEADGGWTYTLNNADTDTNALGVGETGTETFNVVTADGTSASVVVTVTGADDAATIGGQTTGAVTEDDTSLAEASGRLEVVDPDTALTNEQKRFTEQTDVDGTYGTFTLEADGGWTYTLNNADTDTNALGVGEIGTETFNVATADGSTSASVVVTVTGADDAARIEGDTTGAVTEDDTSLAEASGTLEVVDPDTALTNEQKRFTEQTDVDGTYGTFTLEADGGWSYELDNADTDTNALGAGETGTETFIVATADGTSASVVITVTGANDAAAIGGQTTGAVTEDAVTTTATGALTVADPDEGEATFEERANVDGTYGTFTLEADGSWTYTLNNADTDTNALGAGETETETFIVATADGTSALGGHHGDGRERRGGDWRADHRCGDRGRGDDDGDRGADGGRPG